MPRIVLARDLKHEQIDFPDDLPCPEGRRGGRKSALHLRRGSVRDISDAELAWLETNAPEILRCCDILPDPRVSSRAARKLKAAAEKAARAAKASEAPAPKKRSRKSGKDSASKE